MLQNACLSKVIARGGSTSNLISHLKNNIILKGMWS